VFGGHSDDEEEWRRYQDAIQSGNAILSVDVANQDLNRVADILDRYSPVDIHREFGQTGTAASTSTANAPRAAATAAGAAGATRAAANEQRAIPVVEEELKVGKRAVLRGGVRVYSRVVERPVEENIRLREERVRVDRQPVDRPVNEADLRAGTDQVVEVKEYAEEPVVSKQARVVEEVRVNKEATERTEQVRDTVRRTEVRVEGLGEGKGTDLTDDFRRNFTSTYGSSGDRFETYAPAYQYGYEMANDPRYRGRNFSEVESDLRSDYGRRYPNSAWEKMKDAVRYGWDRVTGKTKSAASNR
jgi:stress response protein YsnF